MKLYIMRHGFSPSASEAGVPTDAERPLSERGRQAARASAKALAAKGARPVILHSPLTRAVQTAVEVEGVLKPDIPPRVFEPLSNVLPAEELLKALRGPMEKAGELLVIGHQPQLGELAALLAGRLVDLRPAGLVGLDLPPGASRSASSWTFHPDDAR